MNRKQLQRMRDEIDIAGEELNIQTLQTNIGIWNQELHAMLDNFNFLRKNIMMVRNPAGGTSAHAFGLVSDIFAAYKTRKKEIELRIKNTLDAMGRKQEYINALKKLMKIK